MSARVSVCSSVLNHSQFLRPMLASIIGQSFKDWELILVDDGSTEDIKSICEEWNDERIKYVAFPKNAGVPHGINHAIGLATGEYVQIISADERLDLNKFMWQVGYLDDHPDIAGIWGLPQNGPLGERPEWEQYALRAHNRSRPAWIRTLLNLESIPIGGVSWLVRRSALEAIGPFDPQFYTCSDLEMFVRFFKKFEGRIMPYRWHWCEDNPGALHKNVTAEDFQRDLNNVRAKHPQIYPVSTGAVTVAIPVYNMGKYLPACIESLQKQTVQNFYINILDDASTDNSLEVANSLKDSRTKIYKFDENRGSSQAWNQMLVHCQTPFFMCLAADDTLAPDYLEKCLAEFEKDPWLEFVASQTDFIDEAGNTLPPGSHAVQNILPASNKSRDEWLRQLYYGNQYFGAGLYRRDSLKDIGGLDTEAGILADYDRYLKLLQRENIKIVEQPLTHTRIHEGNASVGPGKIDRHWLVNKYHEIKKRYYAPRMKVVIATPFYEMRGFSPYISSLSATVKLLTLMGIEHEFWELSGDSYVDRAKNTIFNKFLEDPAATDLFMIDSDMQWDPNGFVRMLQLPEGIVMGSYPQKNQWEKYTAIPHMVEENGLHHPVGRMLSNNEAVIKAAFLAGGFIRIKREVLEKYREKYEADYHYYDAGADPNSPERKYVEFFTCERAQMEKDGPMLRWGEDRVFGKRLQAIGIESWIYPNVDFGHYGVKGWMGNYHRWLTSGGKETVQ